MFIPVQDDNPLRTIRHPWVTFGLIGLNICVFILQFTQTGASSMVSFAMIPGELRRVGFTGGAAMGPGDTLPIPEPLTLLSYAFMHGDVLHLATNMLFLWVFGDNVEDATGHARFVVFYLLCGIVAALFHAYGTPWPDLPLIGASGAVAGVVSAYVLLHPRVRVWVLMLRFIPLNISAAVALGIWIAAQFAMLFMRDSGLTAWWAHVGGILAGAALIVVLKRPEVPLFGRQA